MSGKDFTADYVDVAERIREFRKVFPQGSLQPANPSEPVRVVTIGDRTFLTYAAAAYRTPDDPRPGIGVAWEPFPGKTPYTRDSEAMNVETSAWGRAIVAALAGDTKKVASAQEVRNRQADRVDPEPPKASTDLGLVKAKRDVKAAWEAAGLDMAGAQALFVNWLGRDAQLGSADAGTLGGFATYLAGVNEPDGAA